jgi:hypothetical protein
MRSKQFAKHANLFRLLMSDDNICLLLLNKQAGKENLFVYDIDFYGHTHGDVLVALDLGTREVSLKFLPDRKMERVPLTFVNDEAKEFVDGLVHSVMNRYVGIMQITTGGIALDPTQTLNVSCSSI